MARPSTSSLCNKPTRYAVVDDYNRRVRDKPIPAACLNGDTCVRSTLDKSQPAGDLANADTVAEPSFVMNNDLSWLRDATPENALPRLVWHPHFASIYNTYEELARRRPSIRMTCVKACIHYGDREVFNRFEDVMPDEDLWDAAFGQDWYRQWIEDKAKELGINLTSGRTESEWDEWHLRRDEEWWPMALVDWNSWNRRYRTPKLYREITTGDIGFDSKTAAMPGWKAVADECNRYVGVDRIELHVSALEKLDELVLEAYELRDLQVAYRDGTWVEEENIKMLRLYPDPVKPRGGYRRRGRGKGGRVLPSPPRRPAGNPAIPESSTPL